MKKARTDGSGPKANPRDWVSYNFAVLRVVPHVHIGAYFPVGIVLHARTSEFLGVRVITGMDELSQAIRGSDLEIVSRYLESCRAIGEGETTAGPIALAPPSERFHWLTAARSDVIQSGPVHEGLCEDPSEELDRLFAEIVLGAPDR